MTATETTSVAAPSEEVETRGTVIGFAAAQSFSDHVAYSAAAVLAKHLDGTKVALFDCVPVTSDVPLILGAFRPNIAHAPGSGHLEEILVGDTRRDLNVVLGEQLFSETTVPVSRRLEVLEQLRATHDLVVCNLGDRCRDHARFDALAAATDIVVVCTPANDTALVVTHAEVVDPLVEMGVQLRVLPVVDADARRGGDEVVPGCRVLPPLHYTDRWQAARNGSWTITDDRDQVAEHELAVALFGVTGDGRLMAATAPRRRRRLRRRR